MTFALLVAFLIPGTGALVERANAPVVACDSTRLAGVAFLQGEWRVRSLEPGRTPPRERTGSATISRIAGGSALHEDLYLGSDYQETRILAFDERGGAWQLMVIDSHHGHIVLLRGHEVANGFDFISTHQRADRLLIDRVSFRRIATGWQSRIETAPGYGEPWRLLQETTYTRE
jgi:hypothetical protein